ncbi:hypothetical protein PC129_g25565 [Phytophthora cactorum]|uniref:LisH domain-containing protein n=1 Tax=Phytophthora cactorum TaxID=29920 RepID=A0A8T1GTF9_9STRA|nr:hypothetical protein PC129_g25565 [Phytophthora cactorum]
MGSSSKKVDKTKAKAKKVVSSSSSSSSAKDRSAATTPPPGELMDLVETFLSEHSFTGAHDAFKKQREKKEVGGGFRQGQGRARQGLQQRSELRVQRQRGCRHEGRRCPRGVL